MAYDLEEQESLDQLKAWWEKWGTATLSAITVGCLCFAAYNGWNWYQRYQGNKATNIYVQLQNAHQQNDAKNVKSLAEGLMKEYSGHAFASQAALILSSNLYKQGNAAEAKTHLEWILANGQEQYHTVARVRLAGIELDQGNAAKALEIIKAASARGDEAVIVNDRLGDIELALGNVENARKAWKSAQDAASADAALQPYLNLKIQSLPQS